MDRDAFLALFPISVRNHCYYFLVENKFFFHTIQPHQFPLPSLLPTLSSFFPKSTNPPFPLQKGADLQERTTKQDKTKYTKASWKSHIHAEQDNPVGGKQFQEQAEESEKHLLSLLGALQNCQANNHNIYQVDQV